MKRIKLLLTLALLMTAVIGARADEFTVSDGTVTNGYVPVYGFYADAYLKAEMVYPAEDLTALTGNSISSMKFYSTKESIACGTTWGSIFKVFMKEIEGTSLSSFVGLDDATLVYEGILELSSDGVMTVSFSTDYTYNGGNLLIGFYGTTTGTYLSSNWYGTEVTGASVNGYSYSSLDAVTANVRNCLPKATFEYTDPYTLTLTPDATGKVWTLAAMPEYNVKLEVKYYPVATGTAPTARTEKIYMGTDSTLVIAGSSEEGTMMYLVSTTEPTTTEGFSETVPTVQDITEAGNYNVYYYIKGDDTHNDSEISSVAATVLSDKYDITFEAVTANTIEAGKATVTAGGESVTPTNGKVSGVKMGSEVKIKAKEGYKLKSVEAKEVGSN